jgi:hypothetical protein
MKESALRDSENHDKPWSWLLMAELRFEAGSCKIWDTLWHSCLRHCTADQKVVALIPDGVIGIFH